MAIMVVNNGKVQTYSNGNQLTGEKIPGDLNTWSYVGTDPNEVLKYGYDKLSQRSTTLYHTHPPVFAAIQKTGVYSIGPGLVFRSQPDWKYLGIDAGTAKDWSMRFQKLIHYVFLILNFYEKQDLLFNSAAIMGDSLLYFDRTEQPDGAPFDLIEAGGDQINFEATIESNNRTLGIIHDKFLRRKGIVQALDNQEVMFKDVNGDQQVIQYFNKQMARQLRGFPAAYRIIAAAKNNDRWMDATLANLVMESNILGWVESDTDNGFNQASSLADSIKNEDGYSPASGNNVQGNVMNSAPGSMFQFKSGGKITFADKKTPSNNFDKVQKAYLEMVGMAMGVPYEIILSAYGQSFTAHKGSLNDFMRIVKQKRNGFINNVCYNVVLEIAKWAFMENIIEMPKADFFTNPITQRATLAGIWIGPVPGHINPKQEVDALIVAKDNGFITPADAAAQYGNTEWDDQIEEWSQQMKQWQELAPEQQGAIMQEQEEELNADNADEEPEEEESENEEEGEE